MKPVGEPGVDAVGALPGLSGITRWWRRRRRRGTNTAAAGGPRRRGPEPRRRGSASVPVDQLGVPQCQPPGAGQGGSSKATGVRPPEAVGDLPRADVDELAHVITAAQLAGVRFGAWTLARSILAAGYQRGAPYKVAVGACGHCGVRLALVEGRYTPVHPAQDGDGDCLGGKLVAREVVIADG